MRVFPEKFDQLCFAQAHYGAPEVVAEVKERYYEEKMLIITVRNLPLMKGHPLFKDNAMIDDSELGKVVNGLLVFHGVLLSRRRIREYIGDPLKPDWIGEEYAIEDIRFDLSCEVMNVYTFEGKLDKPLSKVKWSVIARSFELQVE
jgi:hypothetical protein